MSKSSWVYILSACAIVIGGVYFAIAFGLKPKPVPKISWSHFVSPADYGANICKRMRLEVQSHNLIFLGVLPGRESHYQAWKGFLDSLEPEFKFEYVIVDATLPHKEILPFTEEISLSENQQTLVSSIQDIINSKKKVVIILPTTAISYLVKDNLFAMLNHSLYGAGEGLKFDVDWLTFSLSSFPLTRDQEKTMDIPCDTEVKDQDGSGALGCMIVTKARTFYRKQHIEGKIPGVLDQIGTKEYLGLFN